MLQAASIENREGKLFSLIIIKTLVIIDRRWETRDNQYLLEAHSTIIFLHNPLAEKEGEEYARKVKKEIDSHSDGLIY